MPTALPIKRTLKLGDDGTLSAPLASTYLGFDASSNNNPPTSTSDPRMWDPLPGTSGREGLYTDLSITVKPNAIIAAETVRCQLSIVQKLETGWSVRVREGDTHALHGKSGKFQVGPATGGSILDAKANPSSRLDDCKGNNASSKDKTTVLDSAAHFHFLSSARVRTCPKVEEFEAVLKPNNPEP